MAVAALLAWSGWATVVVATLVPRTTSLTVYRVLAPLPVAATAWAFADGAGPVAGGVGLAFAGIATVTAFLPVTGEVFVDGSSYGAEQRRVLRPPAGLLVAPVPLTWLATVAGPILGPLLLADKAWAAGAVVTVAGVMLARVAAPRLHTLSRRWVVFVPAGMVLHDPLALADAVLLTRRSVIRLGPAPADSSGVDLSAGALGLVLEVTLAEPVEVGLPARRRAAPKVVEADRLLFVPSRPASLLAAAAAQRLPVGSLRA